MERHGATADDVLGVAAKNGKIDPKWRRHLDRLIQMREELLERREGLGRLDTVEEANFNVNPADRGTDEFEQEQHCSLLSSNQNLLFEIDEALARIRDGAYGVCQVTGEKIPDERLEAVPWTRYALEVEENLERADAARKPKHAL